MVELGDIVTLENGLNFLLVNETYIGDTRYVYAILAREDESLTKEFAILEVVKNNGKSYIKAVDDYDTYAKLVDIFDSGTKNQTDNEKE